MGRFFFAFPWLGAARQHQWVGLDYRPHDPELFSIEPENGDLLQLASEIDRGRLLHDHGYAAFAMGAIRRARVHVDEPVAELLQAPVQIALALLVLRGRQILATRVERGQDGERSSETGRLQP